MPRWRSLLLALLGTTILGGCDPSGSEQARVESQSSSVERPGSEQASDIETLDATDSIVAAPADSENPEAIELDWEALIPEDWRPETLMADVDIDSLSDDDPRAQELLDKLKDLWSDAPVVSALDGQRVKLPGFVVPIEMDEQKIDQFLLVPYYGACIHVPPPPANQTVHVVTRDDKPFTGQLFDVVWVTGKLRVEHTSSDLGEAGYRLEDASAVPYE